MGTRETIHTGLVDRHPFLSGLPLLQIMRPKQWIKNGYLFAPLIFSGNILNLSLLLKTVFAFAIFCIISSAVYVLNDIVDINKDKSHPLKKNRPLPSGRLPVLAAVIWMIMLVGISIMWALSINLSLALVVMLYFATNVAYSFYFKNEFLVDALVVGFGFVLRAASGATVIHVTISPWLFVCTILLSLFLVLGKRRGELIRLGENAEKHRRVLKHYSVALIDQFLTVIMASTIMAYALYSFAAANRHAMMFSIPFVLYGLFRYLYLLHNTQTGDTPEDALLSDIPSLINVGLWAVISFFVLYNPTHFAFK